VSPREFDLYIQLQQQRLNYEIKMALFTQAFVTVSGCSVAACWVGGGGSLQKGSLLAAAAANRSLQKNTLPSWMRTGGVAQDEEDNAAITREVKEECKKEEYNEIKPEGGNCAGRVGMHAGEEGARGGHTEVVHERGSHPGNAGNVGLRYNEDWDQEGIYEGNNSATSSTLLSHPCNHKYQ
jgi:hypothetical protein